MLTYSDARDLFGELVNNKDTSTLAFGDTMINRGIRNMIGNFQWPFLETSADITTVASQQFYDLPNNYRKLINTYITIGDVRYAPTEITSRQDWEFVNATDSVDSDIPEYYYIYDGQIAFWPTPSSNGNTITINYIKKFRNISEADYSTGNVTDVTNGSKTVTGNSTSWDTNVKPGESINIAYPDGDGEWYEIDTVDSATQLTLTRNYQGASISGGSASYTIGDIMLIPEDYQEAPVLYAAYMYWLKGDSGRASAFREEYELMKQQMKYDYGNKTTDPTVEDGLSNISDEYQNPNLFIQSV